jgi:hypothetical protein
MSDSSTVWAKPCPFCKSLRLQTDQFNSDRTCWAVCCEACGTIGPEGKTLEAAVTIWNSAPRSLPGSPDAD